MQAIPSVIGALASAFALLVTLSGCSIVQGEYHESGPGHTPRALLVLTNHAELGDTGEPTGAYLSEVAHPWRVFSESGFAVTLASPEGGHAPLDPRSLAEPDDAANAFLARFTDGRSVHATVALADVRPDDYAIVFFAGGHGTMWDLPDHSEVIRVGEAVYARGGVVGAVCHGPAALVNMTTPDGAPLVAGRRVTAFTNGEEAAVNLTDAMPFLLESRLRELGAGFVPGPNFEENVVTDGRLVTGQNPASATRAARAAVARVTLDRRVRAAHGAAAPGGKPYAPMAAAD